MADQADSNDQTSGVDNDVVSVRTFDHMGKTREISFPELSDIEMAGKVRMLTQSDWQIHEFVVCGARDRILALSKEKKQIESEVEAAMREIHDGNYDGGMAMLGRICGLKTANETITSEKTLTLAEAMARKSH